MSHSRRRHPAGHHAGELPLLALIFFFIGLAIGLHFA
jgi:hypothetical protein